MERSAAPITLAAPGDLEAVRDALADAFTHDPVFAHLLPDHVTRPARLRRFFDLELTAVGFPRGEVWTTDDHAGAAITFGPGKWRMPWATLLRHAPAYVATFGRALARATVLEQRMELRHLRERHQYVAYIGVAGAHQGRGLGGALLAPIVERCERDGLPGYLEATSARSAALYERHGFRATGELGYGGVEPLILMRRP